MPAPRPGTARRLLRALVSTLALTALLAGLPYLLYATTTAVWAQGTDALAHLFTRQDTGTAFMLALCAIGWIAWTGFTLSVLLEIPAQLRGRRAPSLPGLRLSQRAAGTLVSGILVAFTSSTLASATPALATPLTVATTGVSTEAAQPAPAATPSQDTAQTAGTEREEERTYTVRDKRPAESLWSIAEKLYGHGELYTKIAEANEGRTMADGTVFHADAPIQPGWVLALPDPPRTDTPKPSAQTAGASAYTVRGGDTLWKVAEDQLGAGERYEELFEANKGARQPQGGQLTDPDQIQVGLTLAIPQAPPVAPPASRPSPDRSADPEAAAPERTPTAPTPPSSARPHNAPSADASTAPPTTTAPSATPAPTPPKTTPGARTENPQHTQQPPIPDAPDTNAEAAAPTAAPAPSRTAQPTGTPSPAVQDSGENSSLVTALAAVGGALVAGGVVLMLRRRRALQRRRRASGRNIAMPTGRAAVTERALRSVDSSTELLHLDAALRTLASRLATEEQPLPALAAAQLGSEGILLHLADSGDAQGLDPVSPFHAVENRPGVWWCPADSAELLGNEELAGVAAPYPALMPLGDDPDGGILLVDLDEFGALHLTGSRRLQVLRTLGISLALSPLGQVDVLVAGNETAPGLSLLDDQRAQPHVTLESAADAAHRHHASQQQLMADADLPDLCHARVSGDAAEFHPLVVLSDLDTCPGPEAVTRLDTLLDTEPLSSTAVITSGAQPARSAALTVWEIDTDAPSFPVPDTSLRGVLSVCTDDEYADILTLAVAADSPTGTPAAAPVPLAKLLPHAEPAPGPAPAPEAGPGTDKTKPSLLALLADLDDQPDEEEAAEPAEKEPAPEADSETVTETPEETTPTARTDLKDSPTNTAAAASVPVLPATTAPGHVTLPISRALPQISIRLPRSAPGTPTAQSPTNTASYGGSPTAELPDIDFPDDRPLVRVLGAVEITRARGTVDSNRRTRATELAAYLVLHPGATAPQIDEVLSPRGGLTNPNTRNTRLRDVRRWLGLDDNGQPFFRRMAKHADGHRLVGVECDWSQFQLLHDVALQVPRDHGQVLLRRALELVRGRPFSGVSSTYYSWAEPIVEDINDKVVNSASLLADWCLEAGDGPGALWAAGRGLEVAREREELWRHRFRALALLGDHDGLEEAIQRLEGLLVDHGWAMEEDTSETIRMVQATRR